MFYYISGIVMAALAIVSAFIAYKSYKDSKKRRKREKSVELAKFYADNIIEASTFIDLAISKSEFYKISKECFDFEEIKNFNNTEMLKLLNKCNESYSVEKLQNEFDNMTIEDLIVSSLIYNNNISYNKETILNFYFNSSRECDDVQKIAINKCIELHMKIELSNKINDLLNYLEYFSMNFITGVADEKTIYQSLHQSFLGMVQELYFFIAKNNDGEHNKYFTNIISLYNIWSKRVQETENKEIALENKYNIKKNKLSKNQKSI